ncbi:hypothetical protein RchiOBHm_Chr2g0101151 [Rosa chinensis]|uniref:Uncharacterized protein n=1 Tax=Rosa chinensis TaxID=74649 RepID=A0A2P6RMC7_ROSCH|nr:hypothetical protein RchiOBHm_Chr2g0101151 [Rosa chinensis]
MVPHFLHRSTWPEEDERETDKQERVWVHSSTSHQCPPSRPKIMLTANLENLSIWVCELTQFG